MRNKAIEYPHPVLNSFSHDFIDCTFSLELGKHNDTGSELYFEIKHSVSCPGIEKMIEADTAKVILRVTCPRTSFRYTFELEKDGVTPVIIPKKFVTDVIDMQAMIVATQACSDYELSEFNGNYFGSTRFTLRKGDILANEPGVKIKLNTVLERNAAGIVQVRCDQNARELSVHYAKEEDEDPTITNYIYISLPDNEYKQYAKLMTKKHLKNGVERFLQCSIVLPAITEGISRLRKEAETAEDDIEEHYKGTVWGESVLDALRRLGIDDLASCSQFTDYELANKLLGNVAADSLNNLMQKMTEWSTIRQEDEVL